VNASRIDPHPLLHPLGDDEVHVWSTRPDSITDAALLHAYGALMTGDERARQGRFRLERSRHEHLVTRALLRTVLSRYLDRAPTEWRFVENRHGRPELAPGFDSRLRFNLSHTEGLIACAVTLDRDVGVDVEALDRRGETVRIADRFFSPSEVRALRALPESERRERFFSYWTLKEAYIKARGLGLAIPLGQFSFELEDTGRIGISFDAALEDDPDSWQFALYRPSERHRLAIGVRRGRAPDLSITIHDHYTPLKS
jgi:4'-phosphopantetheinyl transferase